MVWVGGFEPPIPGARNRCSARLSHTQMSRDGRNRTSTDSLMRAAARLEAPRMQEPELNRQSRDYEPRLGPSLPAAPLPGIEPGQQASEACISCHENRGREPRVRARLLEPIWIWTDSRFGLSARSRTSPIEFVARCPAAGTERTETRIAPRLASATLPSSAERAR